MKVGGLAERVAQLDLVDVEVAPNDDEHKLAVGNVEHGLQGLRRSYVEEVDQLIDGTNAGCVDLFGRLGILVRQRRLEELGLLRVGGVVASRADDDRVLAPVGDEDELLGVASAHCAGVSVDDDCVKAAPVEDASVRCCHGVVAPVQPFRIGVEAVCVLHVEFADADEPASRSRLVPELCLNLVQNDGEVPVAVDVGLNDVGQQLLAGGREREPPVAAVCQSHHVRAVGGQPAGLLPDLQGLKLGHVELLPTGGVHLLADDLLDLPDGAPCEGQVAVHTRCTLVNHSRLEHELMAGELGVGGIVSQCLAK